MLRACQNASPFHFDHDKNVVATLCRRFACRCILLIVRWWNLLDVFLLCVCGWRESIILLTQLKDEKERCNKLTRELQHAQKLYEDSCKRVSDFSAILLACSHVTASTMNGFWWSRKWDIILHSQCGYPGPALVEWQFHDTAILPRRILQRELRVEGQIPYGSIWVIITCVYPPPPPPILALLQKKKRTHEATQPWDSLESVE